MTAVKICGLTRSTDAFWAWRQGADLLGFILWPQSARAVSADSAAEITQSLRTAGCRAKLVGVFVNEEPERVHATVTQCDLDLVQLHGGETPQYAHAMGLPYLLARRVRGTDGLGDLAGYKPWAFLLDSYDPMLPGGTGVPWAWDQLGHRLSATDRFILAGGLTPENVRVAMRTLHPWGVDVASGVERAPGIKNPKRVAEFIQRVREEDQHDVSC